MKNIPKIFILFTFLFIFNNNLAQHYSNIIAEINNDSKTISVYQEFTFFNQTKDTLNEINFNDWNNSYSTKNTPLAKRFSDEYVRNFHLANEKERGNTSNLTFIDQNKSILNWCRFDNYPDIVQLFLKKPLLPNHKQTFTISYILKIPNEKFTGIGYNSKNEMILKNCFITPSRYENHEFVTYENLNLDDQANAIFDFDLKISTSNNYKLSSDLIQTNSINNLYEFSSKNILNYTIYLEEKNSFSSYKNSITEVYCNLKDSKINEVQKAIIIDKIVNYVNENIGNLKTQKIVVSQFDYDQNPFYGFNQLPSFISPFSDDFVYELKFLKTYLNNYLRNSLQLDQRKNNWIFDAIQVYYMMKYIDEFYPNAKMMGSLAKYKLLKGYHLISLDFNEQYSYFYMLMARKNLDQPLNKSKEELIKFNEKIASKYRAGLSFRYLADYIGEKPLQESIFEFVQYARINQTNVNYFQNLIQSKSPKKIDWFFKTIINSQEIIDYNFKNVTKSNDSVSFSLENKTKNFVPITVYGIKNKQIVFKHWIDTFKKDSIYTYPKLNADKLVINYKNEVPEFNQRNNWKSLKTFFLTNKPIKFNFMKDLEDPNYNQILYVPDISYNLYDGIIFGLRIHNKTLLNKPISIDVTPSYSTNSQSLSGNISLVYNDYIRNKNNYYNSYGISGNYFHYAPEATYQRLTPYAVFRFRNKNNYRLNYNESIAVREVYVKKEPSPLIPNTANSFEGSYAIFDARYNKSINEMSKYFGYSTNLQISGEFSKFIAEVGYRKLFDNNRQISIRFYFGTFLHNNSTTNYYTFALDRPSDYLFDYSFYGRSENSGIFAQQYITADGGFKSIIIDKFANKNLTAINLTTSIWNWIEIYADAGILNSKSQKTRFCYDSGIRLNLVPGYFELFFPVQSTNGFEITQPHYNQKIRFSLAFSTKSLVGLFTRKWF